MAGRPSMGVATREEDPVTLRLVGYELALGDGWTVVPEAPFDVTTWALEAARHLVGPGAPPATGEPPSLSPEAGAAFAAEPPADPVADLAEAITAVVASASGTGVDALTTAFLVRDPSTGSVDAMVTLVAQTGLTPEAFLADLERLVAESDDPPYLYAQQVEADLPGGAAHGAHLMIGHVDPELGQEVAHLEERVVLGVFPPDCPDMIELTAVSAGVDVFDDMPQTVIDLAGGLTPELGRA
jgi:hypothetical protein